MTLDDIHTLTIDDKSLYQLMIANVRYAFPRDNGLASGSIIDIIKTYLPLMGEEFRESTAKQLIQEVIGALKVPELNGGLKHIAKLYNKTNDAYRVIYISDFEYQRKELLNERNYTFNDLKVHPNICFEDELDWRDLIKFLSNYIVSDNWKPYNDDEGNFYKRGN